METKENKIYKIKLPIEIEVTVEVEDCFNYEDAVKEAEYIVYKTLPEEMIASGFVKKLEWTQNKRITYKGRNK